MDLAARALDMDPVQFRLQNIAVEGDIAPSGEPVPKVGYKETLEKMAEYLEKKGPLQGKNRGRGISCGFWHGASGPYAVYVTVNTDGSVTLYTGVTDVSGSRTSIAQIVAEEFDLPVDKVNVVVGDTDSAPWASPSVGSMTLYSLSKATYRACQETKGQLKRLAAIRLETDIADLELMKGRVMCKKDPHKSIKLESLARAGLGARSEGPVGGRGAVSVQPPAPVVSVNAVDIEVDPETGKVRILSYAASQDVGRAINPLTVEGQIQGAVVQGIGWALMEGYVFDQGKVLNKTLLDYRIPTAMDVPMIDVMIIEVGSSTGVYGLKQAGEAPLVPVLSAMANAIHSASGVRITSLPMTPEVIWKALKNDPS
jgi:xanthine dehydrogenase molybdenum-binding subunit